MYKSLNHKKSLKFSKPEEQGKWHRQNVTSWFSIILMRILMKFGVNNLEAHSKYIFLTVFVYLKIWGSYAVSKCHLPRIWPRHPQPMYKIHGLGDWLHSGGRSVKTVTISEGRYIKTVTVGEKPVFNLVWSENTLKCTHSILH